MWKDNGIISIETVYHERHKLIKIAITREKAEMLGLCGLDDHIILANEHCWNSARMSKVDWNELVASIVRGTDLTFDSVYLFSQATEFIHKIVKKMYNFDLREAQLRFLFTSRE